jgi:hypothetical protein
MAAFLTVDVLRAHAALASSQAMFGHAAAAARPRSATRPRPILGARWRAAPDGRLTCRWQTVGSTPFGIPPD